MATTLLTIPTRSCLFPFPHLLTCCHSTSLQYKFAYPVTLCLFTSCHVRMPGTYCVHTSYTHVRYPPHRYYPASSAIALIPSYIRSICTPYLPTTSHHHPRKKRTPDRHTLAPPTRALDRHSSARIYARRSGYRASPTPPPSPLENKHALGDVNELTNEQMIFFFFNEIQYFPMKPDVEIST